MASFNKIIIVGYLGRDPELRYTPNGNAVCNFSVATTEKRGDQETTTWFKISAWGRQGELCNEYLAKGRQVYVEGRVRMEEYTDRDGNKRNNLEVNATDVKFLSPRNGGGEYEAPSRDDSQGRREALSRSEVEKIHEGLDNEVPF